MTVSNQNPISDSLVLPGDEFSFELDDGGTTPSSIQVTVKQTTDDIAWSLAGGFQPGFSGSAVKVGNVYTITVSCTAGYDKSPFTVQVDWTISGSPSTSSWSYSLATESLYPDLMQPRNPDYQGTLKVTDNGVSVRTDTGWIDLIGFTVVDLGNGKVSVTNVGGGGSGDVVGPAGATDDAIAVYDGGTGKLIKDSTGTIAQITANTAKVTNATHTGDVTGATALTIGAKRVTAAMMEDGVDGELFTWDASGAIAKVPVGTATHVLTSNGVGAPPTFQAAAAASGSVYGLGTWAWADTPTTATDPGSGNVRMNHASPPFATAIYISATNALGLDHIENFQDLQAGDWLVFREDDNSWAFRVKISSTPTDNTGWFTVPITVESNAGSIGSSATLRLEVVKKSAPARWTEQMNAYPSAAVTTTNYYGPNKLSTSLATPQSAAWTTTYGAGPTAPVYTMMPTAPVACKVIRWSCWARFNNANCVETLYLYKMNVANGATTSTLTLIDSIALDSTGLLTTALYDYSKDITTGNDLAAGDGFIILRKNTSGASAYVWKSSFLFEET